MVKLTLSFGKGCKDPFDRLVCFFRFEGADADRPYCGVVRTVERSLGSDLWPYRGIASFPGPTPMGHEYCGIVEDVGGGVTSLKRGQFVIGSFFASDNTCPHCRRGYQTSRVHRGDPTVNAFGSRPSSPN
jgi:Alcohol dehydrogenase GroES-like domain